MPNKLVRCLSSAVLSAMCFLPTFASAQPSECRSIVSNTERLACYDSKAPPMGALPAETDAPDPGLPKDKLATFTSDENDRQRSQGSALTDSWELSPASKRSVFALRPYKPMYILPVSYTNHINRAPLSSVPGRTAGSQDDLDSVEARFQFSVKTKIAEDLIGKNGDLWLGYTQSSRWQMYNEELSRPFRETNYEPEAMLVFHTDYEVLGFKGVMASIGVNHQSNGRAQPLSRDWNRIVAQVGFERGDWIVMLRPWWRLPESEHSDDNPGIENYIGRGEITVARTWQGHVFSLQARHSLRSGEKSRGSAQAAWSFPIAGDLKGYVQVFSGYGESLIDFNNRQTVIGLGFSVVDWF